jgi:glycosyltransferase involved in cell wall biosynthesis
MEKGEKPILRVKVMKVLLINDYATPAYGSENETLELRDLLRQRGHDARLFASSARVVDGQEVLADYQCFGTFSHFNKPLQTANPLAFWKLRLVLKEFQPDVVDVRIFRLQLSPLILPLLRNVPSLYHVIMLEPICPIGIKMLPDGTFCRVSAGTACYHNRCFLFRTLILRMLSSWLWKRWRRAFNLITTNSHAMRRLLIAEGIEVAEVVWNAVPNRLPRPPLSSPPTVAFAGRMVFEKGVYVLVKAFAKVVTKIPSARLILAGDGLERHLVERLVANLGLSSSVSMPGHIPRLEMERFFDSAWVQAVPSLCYESFGRVAAEAMMRGTAVVASASGGLTEIVGDDGRMGLLVPPGDERVLAEALLQLLQNRDFAEQMGKAGREFATVHFDQETYIRKILQLYETIC